MKTELRTDITIAQLCKGFHYSELEGKELYGMDGTAYHSAGIPAQLHLLRREKGRGGYRQHSEGLSHRPDILQPKA